MSDMRTISRLVRGGGAKADAQAVRNLSPPGDTPLHEAQARDVAAPPPAPRRVYAGFRIARQEVEEASYTVSEPDLLSIIQPASIPTDRPGFAELAMRERVMRFVAARKNRRADTPRFAGGGFAPLG